MRNTQIRRTAGMLLLKRSRCSVYTGRILLVVLALLITSAGINPAAQAAPTLSTPTVSLTSDNCVPSSLAGPNYPEPGDTLLISSTFTNDTGSPAAFRAVVRVIGTRGGTGINRTVDLLYGGPTYIRTSGVGGTGWDDSYGYVVNTPVIRNGVRYILRANFSLLRQQLANALNLGNNATGSVQIRVELFSSDLSVFYGSSSVTQTIKNTPRNGCARDAITDSSPVLLATNKALYTTSDTIHIEYSTIGADDVNKLPGWGDTNAGTVDVVRLDQPPTGDPELDYSRNTGTIAQTLTSANWLRFDTPTCTIPCVVTDERIGTALNYSSKVGSNVQAFTNRATIAASSLTNNKIYLVRARFGQGNGSSSHPIQQPQWTYFTLGTAEPLAVTLVSFTATPQADDTIAVRWETATEYNTQGFYLYRSADATRESAIRVTPDLIFSEGSGVMGAVYGWIDRDVVPGPTYTYWLHEVETSGATNEYGPTTATIRQPGAPTYAVFVPFVGR